MYLLQRFITKKNFIIGLIICCVIVLMIAIPFKQNSHTRVHYGGEDQSLMVLIVFHDIKMNLWENNESLYGVKRISRRVARNKSNGYTN